MESLTAISARLVFARHAMIPVELERRLREELRWKEVETRQQEQLRRDKKEREEARDQVLELAVLGALASSIEIADFTVKLDRYDALTVEALMENEQALTAIDERIGTTLRQAIQLPDGRRVFKSEDGSKVFDEHGQEVSLDEIRPEQIPDDKRRFEPYWADRMQQRGLTQERQELLDYQDKLDKTRERLDDKGLTRKELQGLDDEIEAAMPDRLRRLKDQKAEPAGPDATPQRQPETAAAMDLDEREAASNSGRRSLPQGPMPGG